MKLSDFYYDLPSELIARYPLPNRSSSRLLCLSNSTKEICHKHFFDLPSLLKPKDLLIFNNTKVIPARLFAKKLTGGHVEILIERILPENQVMALLRVSKSPKPGSFLQLTDGTKIEVLTRNMQFFHLQFPIEKPILEVLEQVGHMPLPPYLEREDELNDRERYQTVYAQEKGAVAAPTAGLHFDKKLLQQLIEMDIEFGFVTLHVGAGTFQPVRVADIEQHQMHHEYINVPELVCQQIASAKARGNRVVAVGTTSVRSLETASVSGLPQPYRGDTNIFIHPGFKFNCIDALITNFHLPESTLLMLVSAFAGHQHVMETYRVAVNEKYRFFSYGDAMFIA